MSRPLPPTITVRSGAWQRTFAPGRDVVIGRDVRADVRLPHPGISRVHVLLRYLDGHWVAIDNKSFNGMFVGHRRVQSVDIRRQETIHIGNPDGPRLVSNPVPSRGRPISRRRGSGRQSRTQDRRRRASPPAVETRPPDEHAGGGATGIDHHRPRLRQRRRDPRHACLGTPRDADADAAGCADPGRQAAPLARSSTASASRPRCSARTTSSPSATSTWCSPSGASEATGE